MADIVCRRPRTVVARWDRPVRLFFEDFFRSPAEDFGWLPELWSERHFVPVIDVTEDEEGLTLTAEMPGMNREGLEVTVEDGVLALRGEKKEEQSTEGADYHRVERTYGHFERRIRLPDYVDTERIEATYADGVLTLRMPKGEAARARSIKIEGD